MSPTRARRSRHRTPTAEASSRLSDQLEADIVCRLATEDDLDGVVAFFRRSVGVDIPPDYWRWRYFENPAGRSGVVLALDDGQIVGIMSVVAMLFRSGDQWLVGNQLEQNSILPSHRSKTVYFQLCSAIFEHFLDQPDVDFAFGVALQETRDLSTVMLGFDEVGPIRRLLRIVNPIPYVRKRLRLPLPRSVGGPLVWWQQRGLRRALKGLTLCRFERFSELDDWVGQSAEEERLLASRDPAQMEWRYVECPLEIYGKWQLRSGEDLLGWFVFHTFEDQGVRYGVLDECVRAEAGNLALVVQAAISTALEHGVDAIVAWTPMQAELCKTLADQRFLQRPSPLSLIVRQGSNKIPDGVLTAEESWYYTIGDTDAWLFSDASALGVTREASR